MAKNKRPQSWLSSEDYFEKHDATFTVQFPEEKLPVPEHGRYQLHNEIDDCIVCDKCAKICPVDCITIEPIRATETYGHTSDGSPLRLYPAKFDIDMSQCFFCGLCTVVCPTKCLTMTEEYDYSTFDVLEHNFEFSKMTTEEIEVKKREFNEYQEKKMQEKTALKSSPANPTSKVKPAIKPKPLFKKP